jgi:hypothetical protein
MLMTRLRGLALAFETGMLKALTRLGVQHIRCELSDFPEASPNTRGCCRPFDARATVEVTLH